MDFAPAPRSYSWKKKGLHSRLIKAWLVGLLSLWGCFQGSQVREDNNIVFSSEIRPIDIDISITKKIGQEALDKIGYDEIIKLAERAGFVEYKSSFNIQLISYESAVTGGFASVFSRYALAAAVTSQADSPLPGPADLAAIGVVVVGLIDAGLLDGYLLNTTGAWLVSRSGKPLMSKASTNEAQGTSGTIKAPGSGNAGGGTTAESAGPADATGAESAGRTLSAEEAAVAGQLVAEGHMVEALVESSVRTADFLVDGKRTELKSISNITSQDPSGALARRILDGAGQAPSIIADLRRQAGMTEELALRAVRRAFGADRAGRVQSVRLIGQGFDVTIPRVASPPPAGL